MCFYASLWILMGPDESVWVLICVLNGPYVSLCVLIDSNGS